MGLGLAWSFHFLYLPFDSSVCWCLIRWIWGACSSPATCLICLAVAFEFSYFLASWCTLLAGNFPGPHYLHLWSWKQIFLTQKEQKYVPVQDLFCFRWVFCETDLCLYIVAPFIYTFDPWQKLVNKSNLAQTLLDWGLQNSSNWDQIVSNSNSSFVKPQDTYWSISKSPLNCYDLLASLWFWECSMFTLKYALTL